jgi:hypothetical protein
MSATELQACLARLYTSWAFRRLLRLDPDAALAGYFLTEAERDAILEIDSEMLDWFAASLKAKRRMRLERSFPALFAIGSPAFGVYFDRFHEIYPLRPGETSSDDAEQFGRFVEETLADGEQLPPYARDLARFELTLQELRRSVRAVRTPSAEDSDAPMRSVPQRPRRRDGVRVARFAFNVSEIDDALREGREPEPRTDDEVIVYILRDAERDPRILRVSDPTAVVIDLCDGSRSVSDVVAAVEEHYGQAGLGPGIEEAILELTRSAILVEADAAAA